MKTNQTTDKATARQLKNYCLPWTSSFATIRNSYRSIVCDVDKDLSPRENQDNAALIVQAVNEHAALKKQVADQAAEILLQNQMIDGARKAASKLMIENSALLVVSEAAKCLSNEVDENWNLNSNLIDALTILAALRAGK